MSSGTLQLILALACLIAAVLLVLTGHSTEPLTSALVGILGVAAGFFFRDAASKANNANKNDPGGGL